MVTSDCTPTIQRIAGRGAVHSLLAIALSFFCHSVQAEWSISLLAVFGDKALIHVDGEQRLLHSGETSPEGVSLISTDSDEVVVEVKGKREVLGLNLAAYFPGGAEEEAEAPEGAEKVSMWADSNGFFHSMGMLNGFPVRFLVDTGANSVAISSLLADRIGLNYRAGEKGVATTAAGITPMYRIVLDKVVVGDITMEDVEASVVIGSFPQEPLLGMSFLGQLDMVRKGDRMDLQKRF